MPAMGTDGTTDGSEDDGDEGSYDAALRSMVEVYLPEFVTWLLEVIGVPAVGVGGGGLVPLQARFGRLVTTREADLLVRIGPDRLLHVEYESHPKTGLALRMLEYRNLIMHRHPHDHLNQVVLLLLQGAVDSIDDHPNIPADSGFRLGVTAVAVAQQDAAQLARRTGVEPLEIHGTRPRRERP
jgi:hypothetical protein